MSLLTSQLHLPAAATLEDFLAVDRRLEGGAVKYAAQTVQHLRQPVVREHGDLVDIPEGAVALAVEARPQVGNEDLGPLEEADGSLVAAEHVFVTEAAEVARQDVD